MRFISGAVIGLAVGAIVARVGPYELVGQIRLFIEFVTKGG